VTQKWLADLVSIPPERQHQIPQELLTKNYVTGRIVLEEGDPHISLLALLGCRLYKLNSLVWESPEVEKRDSPSPVWKTIYEQRVKDEHEDPGFDPDE
jgi:hypothetical protein